MKILSAQQIQMLDRQTITNEPVSSLDLMERAAQVFCQRFMAILPEKDRPVFILCGKGNNGGDGLAIARILHQHGYPVSVLLAQLPGRGSPDYHTNKARLHPFPNIYVRSLTPGDPFPLFPDKSICIDGLFGSGLNRPLEGFWAAFMEYLNHQSITRVAIDMPSGLFSELPTQTTAFHAHYTLSFHAPKLSFFFPENEDIIGRWEALDIGLHRPSEEAIDTPFYYLDKPMVRNWYRPRSRFAHKGTLGHALLICGSYGMIGAAILSTKASLKSGPGLVTVHLPHCGYSIMQSTVPEALVSIDPHEYYYSAVPKPLSRFQAIGIGCGLGQKTTTCQALDQLLNEVAQPIVLDADAINILSSHPHWIDRVPQGSIFTPHPGEFRRLAGNSPNHYVQLQRLREWATTKKCTFVLKGAHTAIATPDGQVFFNSTGNPGMATAGSGDVLTGIITGLLAQGYSPEHAACTGVFLHGMAGDLAADKHGHEALLASDLIHQIGHAFKALKRSHDPTA